jgi:hypothetical protein
MIYDLNYIATEGSAQDLVPNYYKMLSFSLDSTYSYTVAQDYLHT